MKTAKICCFALGTMLLIAALFLVLHNMAEDRKGGKQAEAVLSELKGEIPDHVPETTLMMGEVYDIYAEYEEATAPEMSTAVVANDPYIGYISIPVLDLELPVRNDWSYDNLKISPCRYVGNIYEDDLIICAHNYNSHFGRLSSLSTGDEIIFTDVTGRVHLFSVDNIEQLPGTAVEEMQFGNAEDWDLTLFTCTLSGQSRVTVRAVKEGEQ